MRRREKEDKLPQSDQMGQIRVSHLFRLLVSTGMTTEKEKNLQSERDCGYDWKRSLQHWRGQVKETEHLESQTVRHGV
jgi:hypothetical protein